PNQDVNFDWYEFTYRFGQIAYGGNTTQVDLFGIPLTARVTQSSSGYDRTVGITLGHDEVLSKYRAAVGSAFKPLANSLRILAPRSSKAFMPGGSQANYLDGAIDAAWSRYASQ